MQSRDELRLEERRFYVWLGVAAAAHLALIAVVVFFQLLYVRMHPPLKVVNVSLVSMPGRPGPVGGPKSIPASPAEAPEAKASEAEPPTAKKVPEPLPPKSEPKVPEPSTVKKIPEKPSVAKAPEKATKKPEVSDERKNLQATLDKLKKSDTKKQGPASSGPSNLSSTLAKLQKQVASEGGGTASSGSGSGAGGGRYGSGGGGAFDPYKAEIAGIIQDNWSFSNQMVRSTSGMEVYVSIYIMPDGSVSQTRYDRKSTSEYLNSSVRRALEKSAPFPPLPKEYGTKGLWVGFVFTPQGINQ